LKAFLTLNDAPFPKVHLLSILVEKCLAFDYEFEQLLDMADELTPFATMFRYPGDILDPEVADAEHALQSATFILEFIQRRLPEGAY
jgi:HEPN domain-containing protein